MLSAVGLKTAEQNNDINTEEEKSKMEKRLNALLIVVKKLYEDFSIEALG